MIHSFLVITRGERTWIHERYSVMSFIFLISCQIVGEKIATRHGWLKLCKRSAWWRDKLSTITETYVHHMINGPSKRIIRWLLTRFFTWWSIYFGSAWFIGSPYRIVFSFPDEIRIHTSLNMRVTWSEILRWRSRFESAYLEAFQNSTFLTSLSRTSKK